MQSILINVPCALNVGFAFLGTVFYLSNRPNMFIMMFRYFISSLIYLSTCFISYWDKCVEISCCNCGFVHFFPFHSILLYSRYKQIQDCCIFLVDLTFIIMKCSLFFQLNFLKSTLSNISVTTTALVLVSINSIQLDIFNPAWQSLSFN